MSVVSGFMRRYWMESMSLVPLDEDWWDRSMEFVAHGHEKLASWGGDACYQEGRVQRGTGGAGEHTRRNLAPE